MKPTVLIMTIFIVKTRPLRNPTTVHIIRALNKLRIKEKFL